MPLYEYVDTQTGATVELIKPVAERDQAGPNLKRVTAPRRISTLLGGRVDPQSADGSVPKAFAALEQSGVSARDIAKGSGFTVNQIKKIWNMN